MKFLYYFYPIIYALKAIRAENKQSSTKQFDIVKSQWLSKIKEKNQKPVYIEKVARDMYDTHMDGIAKIENKAASLLAGVGFPIALLAIVLSSGIKSSSLFPFLVVIFGIAISEMTVSAIGAERALRVGTRYISNLKDLEKFLKKTVDLCDWAATQLANIEMNNPIWAVKGYWLHAGQIHFVRGIVFTSIGILFLIIIVFFPHIVEHFEINSLENVFINDTAHITK